MGLVRNLNVFHYLLIALAAVYVVLRLVDRGQARRYARWTIVALGALLGLAPFAWLVAGVFKTRDALNESVFFPPFSKWSETMTLDNFRELFEGRPSVRGPVYFWEYFLNSTVIATVVT